MSGLQPTSVEIEDTIDQLHAGGDENHLLVRRGPLSQDGDASWRQAQAYVREHRMVHPKSHTYY
ncbi:hypothetical protein [Mycobacterium scrofulaceum]|uniref:hypothetical protein n=1 Tax=Mycobacterium scrofulaceum TaxID=1783 RepID=UPI00114D50E8|nr:hypothetical protein [Mycobacterium scrofulaceum]